MYYFIILVTVRVGAEFISALKGKGEGSPPLVGDFAPLNKLHPYTLLS
jgi:hypothetical protein